MVEIEFIYQQNNITIQSNLNNILEEIIININNKLKFDINNIQIKILLY